MSDPIGVGAPSLSDDDEPVPTGKDGKPLRGAALRAALKNREKGKAETLGEKVREARDKSPRRSGRPSNDDKLRETVAGLYVTVGFGASMMGVSEGLVIAQHAEACAAGWVAASKENAAIRSVLEKLATGSAYTELITSHVALGVAILKGRGVDTGPLGAMTAPNGNVAADAAAA